MIPSYCITLSTTPEKHKRAISLFNDLDLPIIFHIAEKDIDGGTYGCWRSHIFCWNKAKELGHDIIAVFEDDVEIPNKNEFYEILNICVDKLKNDNNLEIVILHNKVIPAAVDLLNTNDQKKFKIEPGIALGAYAYVINLDKFFKRHKNIQPNGNHIDYELFLNENGYMYANIGVIEPVTKIDHTFMYGTKNNYGNILNFLFKITGYENISKIIPQYMKLSRIFPIKLRKMIFIPIAKTLTKKFQHTT